MLSRQKPDLLCFKWRCVLVIWKGMLCIPLTLTGGKRLWQLDMSKRHIFTVRESISNRYHTVHQFLMRSGFVFPGNCLLFKRWRLKLTILKTKRNFHTSFICLFATTMTFLWVDFRLFFCFTTVGYLSALSGEVWLYVQKKYILFSINITFTLLFLCLNVDRSFPYPVSCELDRCFENV